MSSMLAEERDPDLNEEEDIRLDAIREEHWRGVSEEGDDNNNIHALMWDFCAKEDEELINRKF